jgi:NCS1 family nucleobase:cation symporter-1
MGMWPALPGFISEVSGPGAMHVDIVWKRFYQISFFFGFATSAVLFYIFNKIAPPPGLGVQVDFDVDGTHIVDGVVADDGQGSLEKGAHVDVDVKKVEA